MNKVTRIILTFAMVFSGALACLIPASVCYASGGTSGQIKDGVDAIDPDNGGGASLTDIIRTIINVILFIVGILSVIMLIYGGIKYSLSAGDSSKVTSAKNTILYAIVGLVISILAFAIVNFVISSLKTDPTTP